MVNFQSEKFGGLCWIHHVKSDFRSVLDHEILLRHSVARPCQEFYNSDSYERVTGLLKLESLKLDFQISAS